MFVLLAARAATGDGAPLAPMAAALRGCGGKPRLWVDPERKAAAAALKPGFVPEDCLDAQPLANTERVFVCQARLDNREELMDRLNMPADMAIADSSLLAQCYDRWGGDCVHRLVGDFAFAAWHREGRVVAAVDPIGMRRLFWSRIGGAIALAAQLPALLAHPQVSQEPDLAALARLLDAGLDRTATPFRAVRSLPGGHLLHWQSGEVRVERWWRPDFAPLVWHRDPNSYVEELRELFTRAVQAQLRSSSRVSSTLSGGLDSGCVAAVAARLLPAGAPRLAAYTAVPEQGLAPSERPNWEADDAGYAAETAGLHANVDHRLVAPEGSCTLDASARVHERSVTPVKSATNLLWLDAIGRAAAASDSRVLLVGQHGNAAFSWRGDGAVWELARLGRIPAALSQARMEARGRDVSLARVAAGAGRDALRFASRRTLGGSVATPACKYASPAHRVSAGARMNEYALRPGSRLFWATFATTPRHSFWAEPVLQWGIEWRDPTADRRLIERLLNFPWAAFRTGGRERGLARSFARGLLPERVRLRRTQGAQVPEAPSLIAAHAPRYRAALARMRSCALCRELLDLDALGGGVESFALGSRDYAEALALDRAFEIGTFLLHLEERR